MIIDVNVHLSRWPGRRLRGDQPRELDAMLAAAGVEQAWAGSFDAILHKDMAGVNERLARDCRELGERFLPIGGVNPTLPDWEDDVRRCQETHGMRGLRVYPNYHDYGLDDARFAKLLALVDERRLLLQIVTRIEDDRTQHRLLRVPDVQVEPLAGLLPRHPRVPVILLNSQRAATINVLEKLMTAGQVHVDMAMLEGLGGVANLLKWLPHERLLFGSHAPFFHITAATLKLQESELGNFQRAAITRENAVRILNS